jgi:chromosome segregation ATPase
MTTNKMSASTTAAISENATEEPTAFPPPITNAMLQFRLDTGSMLMSGGQRASLTRCAQKFGTYQATLQAQQPNPEDIESAKDDLNRELELFELEMVKLILYEKGLERQVQENQERIAQRQNEIATLQETVKESSEYANQHLKTQNCLSEYEALAKLIHDKHPTSQEELQSKIRAVEKERSQVDLEIAETEETLKVREAQFQLLIQYMLDLKGSLKQDEEENVTGKEGAGDQAVSMEVDDSLYEDL